MINVSLFDTNTLLGVMTEMEPMSSYWLDLHFPSQVTFETQYIDFEKVTDKRKLAPFVVPHAQGRPIYDKKSKVQRFEPAYVKPKDAVTPHRLIRKQPGELATSAQMSPEARMNAVVADVMQTHRRAIERRWEWLAAKAILDAEVTIVDEDYGTRTVVFERDAAHTVVLVGPATWDQPTADIIGDIETWRTMVRRAKFGGPTNRITVGVDVWEVMRQNPEVLKQLDTQVRGTQGTFITGVREGMDVEFVGRLSNTLDIYVYHDYYEDEAGVLQPFMSPKDILLSGPNVSGIRAFGAILDADSMRAQPIFPKMWKEQDPSAIFALSQSAPLMIPVNPNNTLKATVLP